MEKHAFHFFFVSFLKSFSLSFFFISGLLRMQGMILQQMPITAQFRVFQESISFICLWVFVIYLTMYFNVTVHTKLSAFQPSVELYIPWHKQGS